MTADSAIRTLRAAAAAHESLECDEMIAIVSRMNALPKGEERTRLHRRLTSYADSRGRRPTGNVQVLDDPRPATARASNADPGRLDALQERVAKSLGPREHVLYKRRRALNSMTREQRNTYLDRVIEDGIEKGYL